MDTSRAPIRTRAPPITPSRWRSSTARTPTSRRPGMPTRIGGAHLNYAVSMRMARSNWRGTRRRRAPSSTSLIQRFRARARKLGAGLEPDGLAAMVRAIVGFRIKVKRDRRQAEALRGEPPRAKTASACPPVSRQKAMPRQAQRRRGCGACLIGVSRVIARPVAGRSSAIANICAEAPARVSRAAAPRVRSRGPDSGSRARPHRPRARPARDPSHATCRASRDCVLHRLPARQVRWRVPPAKTTPSPDFPATSRRAQPWTAAPAARAAPAAWAR